MHTFSYLFARENDERFYSFMLMIIPALVCIRAVNYHSKGQHYYLVDFCYFATACCLIFISVQRQNEDLFRMIYLYSNGCLGISIAAFKNSVVFHRIDYMVSLAIHIAPLLTCVRLRWSVLPSQDNTFFQLREDLSWTEYKRTMII
jgi:hypothetical protein